MLKLIYHSAVFGPIDLEYDRPMIRVGSSEDNDLVLRHPSVEPCHCLLLFRGERLLVLPPTQDLPSTADLQGLSGPELGPGDTLNIGQLQFSLAHSSTTVALPELCNPPPMPELPPAEAATAPGEEAPQPRYYCPHCRVVIPETQLKRMGLVGHRKRLMCPRCSHLFDTEPAPAKLSPDPKKRLRTARH